MDLTATLILAASLLALAVFAGWRGARPPDFARGPRMIPWRAVMLFASAWALFALVHLAYLVGLKTGPGY
jgi:hypothetical protein